MTTSGTLSFIAGFLAALLNLQGAPPPAPACYLLTTEEISSIVGTTRPLITTNTGGTRSTCIFQNGDKTVTILMMSLGSADAAKREWNTAKRVSAGQDVAGWPTPAYVATIDTPKGQAAIVGLHSSLTFVEAKAIDKTRKMADLSANLQTVMKAYSAKLASQK
jgi:hypothetical protein